MDFTLECSGNADTSSDFFFGGIGTARWGGARLAPLLKKAGVLDEATEVVFWGADSGTVTIRDNVGIVSGGRTGTVEPDSTGGLDLTITEQFARSMSLRDALEPNNLLCYEMNGEPLPPKNGFPVRLIAPGWYGVANVKWLTRIEVMDHRFAGRFMARDYVNVREEQRDGQTVWTWRPSGDRLRPALTERLFRDDPYLLEFDAAVLARREHEGRPAVVLDRTAFYAESGGQPSDAGTLDAVPVVAVIEEGWTSSTCSSAPSRARVSTAVWTAPPPRPLPAAPRPAPALARLRGGRECPDRQLPPRRGGLHDRPRPGGRRGRCRAPPRRGRTTSSGKRGPSR